MEQKTNAAAASGASPAVPTLNYASAEGPAGIGGWLILPAIGLVLGSIGSVVAVFVAIGMFGDIDPRYKAIFTTYLMFDIVMAAIIVFAATRFFGRKRSAPAVLIGLLVAQIVVNALLLVIALGSGAEPFAAESGKALVRSIIPAAIWIPYFRVSKRVQNTFVN